MTYNEKAIEQGQMRLALEHEQRMIARQAEIDSVESVVMKSDTLELVEKILDRIARTQQRSTSCNKSIRCELYMLSYDVITLRRMMIESTKIKKEESEWTQ